MIIVAVLIYFYESHYFDFIVQPSARSAYARRLKNIPVSLQRSKTLTRLALLDSLQTGDSYSEQMVALKNQPFSASYSITIAQGESLLATITTDTLQPPWILEAYTANGSSLQTAKMTDSTSILQVSKGRSQQLRIV